MRALSAVGEDVGGARRRLDGSIDVIHVLIALRHGQRFTLKPSVRIFPVRQSKLLTSDGMEVNSLATHGSSDICHP